MTDDTDTTAETTDGQPDDDRPDHDGPDHGRLDDDQPDADQEEWPGEPGGDATDPGTADDAGADERDVQAYLLKGSLVLLVVLGVVATLQFYLSAQTAIRRLASDEYRPLFVAAFNLVVLLGVGIGVAQVVRRLG